MIQHVCTLLMLAHGLVTTRPSESMSFYSVGVETTHDCVLVDISNKMCPPQ